tara:strand:+ start:1 stop:1719 length:1719 start_codon:yes stop_codon:yes gene_type:complete
MDKNIFEEGPRRGHAAGDTSLEQQASQLASDIKYKARQKMKGTSGSNMSPGQVQQLYRQLLNASPAPGGVKAIVKKKLFGEQVDLGITPVSEHVKDSASYVFTKVFLEDADGKFVIRVTDKATGNTSYRKADRAKIAELRANPNISSVEITGRKEGDPTDDEKSGGKKAKKDYDGDGKIESGTAEYMGSRDKAIKKAMAKEEVEQLDEISLKTKMSAFKKRATDEFESDGDNPKNYTKSGKYKSDQTKANIVKKHGKKAGEHAERAAHAGIFGRNSFSMPKKPTNEEVIYEKEDKGDKKIDVMKKGETNNVVVNPVSEEIKAKLDALKAEKIQEQQDAEQQKKKEEQLAKQNEAKEKQAKQKMMLVLRSKMRALRGGADITASHHPEGEAISEGEGAVRYCPKCDKDETRDECRYGGEYWDENSKPAKAEDPRSMPTKINLAKNKLRAMGLKMSYDMEGESIDEVTYPSDFKKGSAVATPRKGRPQQHDQKTDKYGRRKTVDESAEDRLRDQRMERGGVDGNVDYRRPARTATGPKKKSSGDTQMSAFDKVVGDLKAKYGDKAVMAKKTQRK